MDDNIRSCNSRETLVTTLTAIIQAIDLAANQKDTNYVERTKYCGTRDNAYQLIEILKSALPIFPRIEVPN